MMARLESLHGYIPLQGQEICLIQHGLGDGHGDREVGGVCYGNQQGWMIHDPSRSRIGYGLCGSKASGGGAISFWCGVG